MSTRIYEAYRFPLLNLREGLDYLQAIQRAEVLTSVEKIMEALFKKEHESKDGGPGAFGAAVSLLKDFVCGLNYWFDDKPPDKSYVYVIPFGVECGKARSRTYECWMSPDAPAFIEEFHYQNQVDAPQFAPTANHPSRRITRKQWRQREKIWESICIGDVYPRRWNDRRHCTYSFSGSYSDAYMWWIDECVGGEAAYQARLAAAHNAQADEAATAGEEATA